MKNAIQTFVLAASMIIGFAAANAYADEAAKADSADKIETAKSVGLCETNMIYTSQYGCLPQGACPNGYAQMGAGESAQCVASFVTQKLIGQNYGYAGYTGYTGYSSPCATGFTLMSGLCINNANHDIWYRVY